LTGQPLRFNCSTCKSAVCENYDSSYRWFAGTAKENKSTIQVLQVQSSNIKKRQKSVALFPAKK